MADKIIMTCGDCIHADVCEEAETLVGFSRENIAYCGMFLNAADVVEVVRCKDCHKGRPIDKTKCPEKYFKVDCVVCECEKVVGDEPMIYEPTHFCSYGERRTDNV